MYKFKNIINRIKKLNKEQKEKIIMIICIFALFIYFISSNILNSNDQNKERNNNSFSNSEFSKMEEEKNVDQISYEQIYVHITGEIKNPGVLKISDGTRLADVIEKAGGINKNGDIKYLNLAKKVQDGEKIYIPNKNEIKEFEKGQMEEKIGDTARYIEENSVNNESNLKTENKEKNIVNINKANKDELIKIPGIGDITAQKIIEKRKKDGIFKKIEDIKNVEGIGNAKFEKIKNNICI